MKKPNTTMASSAQALASQFQLAELEPRLENSWDARFEGPEVEVPSPQLPQAN